MTTRAAQNNHRLDAVLLHGIAWTGGLKWFTQLGAWVIALIVARLVTPTGYGLFAMAVVYTGFIQLVNELGLNIALVQRRDLPETEIAQLGGLAALAGLGFALLSVAVSPLIAGFFGERSLRAIVSALSVSFVLRALQVVPRAILSRQLNFRRLAGINAIETGVWSIATLVGASFGFGVWALVGGALLSATTSTVVLWWWRPHRLAWPHDLRAIAGTTQLGWYVVVAQLCWYVYDHADLTLVGWTLGKTLLGAYAKASDIADVPLDRISSLVGQVTPAVFAAARNDLTVLRRQLLGLTEALALVTFPMAVGLALTADVFVMSVLGEGWRPAIVPLRMLGLLGGFRAVFNVVPQMLIATGHAKLNARSNIVMAVGVTTALGIGTHWGVAGVAFAWLAAVPLIAIPAFFRPALRILGISSKEYLSKLWPATSAALSVSAVVLALRLFLPASWPVHAVFLACVGAGLAVYVGVLFLAHGPRMRSVTASVRELRRDSPAEGIPVEAVDQARESEPRSTPGPAIPLVEPFAIGPADKRAADPTERLTPGVAAAMRKQPPTAPQSRPS